MTACRPNAASSADAMRRLPKLGLRQPHDRAAEVGSIAASASMTCSGSVSVTARDGALNFRGRPRRGRVSTELVKVARAKEPFGSGQANL